VCSSDLGAWLVIAAYAVLLFRVKRIGDTASDNFGYLVAVGVSVMLSAQIAVNLGMNVGLVPVTGLPAPLLSYGGSSLLSIFLALGLLLSVYRRKKGTEDMRISLTRSTLD
jgi:rod shape determining protein RodA